MVGGRKRGRQKGRKWGYKDTSLDCTLIHLLFSSFPVVYSTFEHERVRRLSRKWVPRENESRLSLARKICIVSFGALKCSTTDSPLTLRGTRSYTPVKTAGSMRTPIFLRHRRISLFRADTFILDITKSRWSESCGRKMNYTNWQTRWNCVTLVLYQNSIQIFTRNLFHINSFIYSIFTIFFVP